MAGGASVNIGDARFLRLYTTKYRFLKLTILISNLQSLISNMVSPGYPSIQYRVISVRPSSPGITLQF
jgi:hypothetical protein